MKQKKIEKTKLKSNIHRTGVSGIKYRGHYSGRTIAIGNPIKSQSFGSILLIVIWSTANMR